MQAERTVVEIAEGKPGQCGSFPDDAFIILVMHFLVSWHILTRDSAGMVSPPLLFQVTKDSLAESSLVVVRDEMHVGQPIFFATILATKPATYEITASLYSEIWMSFGNWQ